jgi:hypothetical protein
MKSPAMVFSLVFFASIGSFGQDLRYSDFNSDKSLKGSFQSYVSKDGKVYNVGDTLNIGMPSLGDTFEFIYVENGFLEVAAGQAPKPLITAVGNVKLRINKIWIKGTKKTGLYVVIKSKGSKGWLSETYSIELENAVEVGEIKPSVLTDNQVLTEMKRPKD